jgi:hypothetical protein
MPFTINKVVVSCEIGDTDYGRGNKHFVSLSSSVPEGEDGHPLDSDEAVRHGLSLYMKAYETLLQARAVTGDAGKTFRQQLSNAKLRFEKVQTLYDLISKMTTEELTGYLRKLEGKES